MSAARPVAPAPRRPQPSAARPPAAAPKSITLGSVEARIAALEAGSAELKAKVEAEGLKLRDLADAVVAAKARKAAAPRRGGA